MSSAIIGAVVAGLTVVATVAGGAVVGGLAWKPGGKKAATLSTGMLANSSPTVCFLPLPKDGLLERTRSFSVVVLVDVEVLVEELVEVLVEVLVEELGSSSSSLAVVVVVVVDVVVVVVPFDPGCNKWDKRPSLSVAENNRSRPGFAVGRGSRSTASSSSSSA